MIPQPTLKIRKLVHHDHRVKKEVVLQTFKSSFWHLGTTIMSKKTVKKFQVLRSRNGLIMLKSLGNKKELHKGGLFSSWHPIELYAAGQHLLGLPRLISKVIGHGIKQRQHFAAAGIGLHLHTWAAILLNFPTSNRAQKVHWAEYLVAFLQLFF